MTELRVNHNNQMLVFQGINDSTCLQAVESKPKVNNIKSAKILRNTDHSLCNYPLNVVIHKSLATRAQTATTFLGQKYAPIQHNDFISSTVLIGHKFLSQKPQSKTDNIDFNEKMKFQKFNEKVFSRGKSAPVISMSKKPIDEFSQRSFIIKPALKSEIQRKSIWYITKESSTINAEGLKTESTANFDNCIATTLQSNDSKIFDYKMDSLFKPTLSSSISYQCKNVNKRFIIKKKQIANIQFPNHSLLPLMWSEDLKTSSMLGYSKGKAPFQAVLAAQKHLSNVI